MLSFWFIFLSSMWALFLFWYLTIIHHVKLGNFAFTIHSTDATIVISWVLVNELMSSQERLNSACCLSKFSSSERISSAELYGVISTKHGTLRPNIVWNWNQYNNRSDHYASYERKLTTRNAHESINKYTKTQN